MHSFHSTAIRPSQRGHMGRRGGGRSRWEREERRTYPEPQKPQQRNRVRAQAPAKLSRLIRRLHLSFPFLSFLPILSPFSVSNNPRIRVAQSSFVIESYRPSSACVVPLKRIRERKRRLMDRGKDNTCSLRQSITKSQEPRVRAVRRARVAESCAAASYE